MRLINIAYSSMIRQKGKKIFLIIAIVLGCSTIVTLFTFIEAQRLKIESQFDEYGANIVIMPKSDTLSLSYGGMNVSGVVTNLEELELDDVNEIWNIKNSKNIRSVSPKILGAVNVESELESKYALLVGVYFEEEKKIKSWWEVFGEYPSVENEVLIGSDVAGVLKISIGSEINILENNYFVSGVIRTTGSQDDNIIFGDFTNFSLLLKKINDVTMVEVSALCSDCPIETIIEQIKEILPEADIKSIGQVMKQKMETTKQFEKFAITITIVIVLIISALVFTSMMGSVSSKKQEIGIFRAIGFTKSNIIFIILSEAIIISFIAGIIGSFAGMGISYFALPQLTDISIIEFNPLFILISTVSVILLCLIATLYPAYSAAEMDPVTAINSL